MNFPCIKLCFSGAFNLCPPRPKLCPTWSVQCVLDLLKKWSPAPSLDLKCLTLKTSMLVALASCKRPSSLSLFSTKEGLCEIGDSVIRLQPSGLEKSEGLNHTARPLVLHKFGEDPRLCPVTYLKCYLRRTAPLRTTDTLFVSLHSPHAGVGAQSIARWLHKTISQSGQFGTGGSTRAASSSKALLSGASLAAVLEAGDWARVSTFGRFYYKPSSSFQSHVLN